MANTLKLSNYLLCRHGAGHNPRAHLGGKAEAGTARGAGAQRPVRLPAARGDLFATSEAEHYSSRQGCRVVGVPEKCPLPNAHLPPPREVVKYPSLSSTSAPIADLPCRQLQSWSKEEQDLCTDAKMEAKQGAENLGWVAR